MTHLPNLISLLDYPPLPVRRHGRVSIVGAGPGDPELLTVKALRLVQEADVVIYDKLVGSAVLGLIGPRAERIYVGKSRGRHVLSQSSINDLMATRARAGRHVIRLKGGDPFLFGRGGEEVEYLRALGISVEVVPGISSANGCAAAAGIPLTHRDDAQAVTFVTGHAKDGEPDLDWAALVALRQTLVVFMGVATAGRIAGRLIEHGLDPSTPAAVIENGTRPDQKVVIAVAGSLATAIGDHGITGPALLIIGDVVRHADVLAETVVRAAAVA